jgi:SAM-dependent methyltransferase
MRPLRASFDWINASTLRFGMDFRTGLARVARLPRYLRERRAFGEMSAHAAHPIPMGRPMAIVNEYGAQAGVATGQYFHQDLWAARKVFTRGPLRHVDVGSRIDGFVTHVLSFMDVTLVDVRPLESEVRGLKFVQADATTMGGFGNGSVDSLSSLNAIEHFGLGRYGDPLSPDAWADALESFTRVLAPGGRLYLGVPIGRERVEFNAHRVLSPRSILDVLRGLRLVSFAAVDDAGRLVESAEPGRFEHANYSCGLFEFTKD